MVNYHTPIFRFHATSAYPHPVGKKKARTEWRVFVIQILLINKSKFDEFSMSFVRHHVKET